MPTIITRMEPLEDRLARRGLGSMPTVEYASEREGRVMALLASFAAVVALLPSLLLVWFALLNLIRMIGLALQGEPRLESLVGLVPLMVLIWGFLLLHGYYRIWNGKPVTFGPVGFWIAALAFEVCGLAYWTVVGLESPTPFALVGLWFVATTFLTGRGLLKEWRARYVRSHSEAAHAFWTCLLPR